MSFLKLYINFWLHLYIFTYLLQSFDPFLTFLQQTFRVTCGFVKNGLCKQQFLLLCSFISSFSQKMYLVWYNYNSD